MDDTVNLFPMLPLPPNPSARRWSFNVVLGLIGTFTAGTILENSLHSTTLGGVVASAGLTVAFFAFMFAQLEAIGLDETEGRR